MKPLDTHPSSLLAALLTPGLIVCSGPAWGADALYSAPESPAFTYIGTSPTKVMHPGTQRDLAADVMTGVDSRGRLAQGFALEVRPWFLIPGVNIPLAYYRTTGGWILANLQLSAATIKASGSPSDTDISIGLRMPLYDDGDPMRSSEYTSELRRLMLACAPKQPGQPAQPVEVCMAEKSAPLRDQWRQDNWNSTRLTVASAVGFHAPGSALQDLGWSGVSAWVTGSLGLGHWGQVLGQFEYDHREFPDPASEFPNKDSIRTGARMYVGSATVNGFVELSLLKALGGDDSVINNPVSWSGGVEFRVANQTWISTGFGSNFPRGGEKYPVIVVANLRWAVAEAARISANP